jgi:CO/xanthine dehydrogenase Mo-binding subunit
MLATVRRLPGELTGSLQLYGLPSAVEAPPIHSELQQSPRPTPLGVKGLGESGAIAVPTVIANAVADALAPSASGTSTHYRPERLWRALDRSR